MAADILQGRRPGAKGRITQPITAAELQRIIAQWDDGRGVTAAVQGFVQIVPVAERTVWYWIAGRKIHRAMAERIRSLKAPHNPTLR
jgi:hypothetical protein